jgi:hypothetical protein
MGPRSKTYVIPALVASVLLVSARARADDNPVPLEDRWGQASLEALASGRTLSVAAFDAPLRASGYGPLPRDYLGGGFALDFVFARWRLGLQLLYGVASAPSFAGGGSVGASVGDVSFDVGYDLFRSDRLTIFAAASLGDTALMLDARDPHWSYVAQSTGVGTAVSTVEQDSLMLGAQLGFEQLVPLGRVSAHETYALMLSLRAGYQQQVANFGWETSNSASTSLGGLPLVDLGGGWAAVGIGFGVFGGGKSRR